MNLDHPLLTDIRQGITATGSHTHHWGELRREVFPGVASWVALKAWCAENAIECELSYGQSSRASQVQFRRQRKADLAVQAAVQAAAQTATQPTA